MADTSLGRRLTWWVSLLAVFTLASSASATPIVVEFEGTVAAGTLGWGTATTGDPVTGSFTFDDGLSDTLSATDGAARWGVGALTAGLTASLTAGGKTETADSSNDTNGAFVQMFDDSVTNDSLNVSIEGLSIALLKLSPASTAIDALTDSVLDDPTSSAVSILDALDPADFTNSASSTWIVSAGSEQILFRLTDFTVIPEPSVALLVGLGLLSFGAARRRPAE